MPMQIPPGLVRHAFPAMGTRVMVLLPADDAPLAFAVQRLFQRWERTLSRFLPFSELAQLNTRAGKPVPVGPLLGRVLRRALAAAVATDGLFDPTVGRRLRQLGYAESFERIGDEPLGGPVAPTGGWRRVAIDPVSGAVTVPAGFAIDLGGIAKGMAVDAAMTELRGAGVGSALVSAGGDLAVIGLPPRMPAWLVEVDLGEGERETVGVTAGAMATSTVLVRRWQQDGVERHHLIDPRTGLPADRGVRSVTAVAGSCEQAEVAAKTALMLGPELGAAFLDRQRLAGLLACAGGVRRVGSWPQPLAAAS